MRATVSDCQRFLHLSFDQLREQEQLRVSFTKKIRNAKFRKGANKMWGGDVNYLLGGNRLPIGLWRELRDVCARFGFPLEFFGLKAAMNLDVTFETVQDFCNLLMSHRRADIAERELQIDAVFQAVRYRFCLLDLSTSAGKTLIVFMYVWFMFTSRRTKKVLIICPDADLVLQMYSDFQEFNAGRYKMPLAIVSGSSKERESAGHPIVIGNFQTLILRPPSFFADFDTVIIDEGHRAKSNSIKQILDWCVKAPLQRLGLSGSIVKDNSADYYDLISNIGPIAKTVKKREIIDMGDATALEIAVMKISWATLAQRQELRDCKFRLGMDGEKLFRIEQQFIRSSETRMRWIADLVSKLEGNVLLFFIDVKNQYGKRLMERIRQINTHKEVYYIDGNVDKKSREVYKTRMEEGTNKVLVASYDTFGTGKSIKNLHYLVCAESVKSEILVGQYLGRGMRLHGSKDKCVVVDIVDDLTFQDPITGETWKNFMLKHSAERIKHYTEEKLPFVVHEITIEQVLVPLSQMPVRADDDEDQQGRSWID